MPTLLLRYSSNTDPKEIDRRLQHKTAIANNWYEQNGMIVNPDRHQTIVLGKFSFPLRNSIDLLGVSIDNNLSFNYHISKVCDKVNNHELSFLETLCRVYILQGVCATTRSLLFAYIINMAFLWREKS